MTLTRATRKSLTVFLLAGAAVAMMSAQVTMAGTISGNVHDDAGVFLENANVYLYIAAGTSWNYQDNVRTDEFGDFDFGELANGTYYVAAYPPGDNHIFEYYDDVSDYLDKAELVVTEGSDYVLDIGLTTKWVYIDDLDIYPEVMLHEGGTVYLYGTAVNDTSMDLEIYYWVSLEADFDIDYGGREYDEDSEWAYLGPIQFILPAGSTPFSLPITLPMEAQSDTWYDVNMYVALGHPSVPIFHTRVGSFRKLEGR